ncbi:hypothetical protein [Nocardia fusca]|uniref:hypothetical protein n=1 Tax=Nocardia fusca TaxID=941183 RepID=UPI0007A7670D|nr:hypothetical protein [Nocardia fusca]
MTRWQWHIVLLGAGGTFTLLGLWAALLPTDFLSVVANYGPPNTHLARDFAACALTFGFALLVADRRPGWRTPALTVTAVWNGAHTVSHLVDIGQATPYFVGPLEAVLLLATTVVFAALARVSASRGHR